MSSTVEDNKLGWENGYRLLAYALNFKNNLIAGLIFLIIAMLAQLISPMIIRGLSLSGRRPARPGAWRGAGAAARGL